jgi:hypothetical protein
VRKVTRDIDEDVRERVRALANAEDFQQSRRERNKIEMRFAHMKRIFKLERLRLRGLSGKSARGKVTKRTVTRAKSKRAPVKKAARWMKHPVAPTVETVEHPAPEFEEVSKASPGPDEPEEC